MPLSDKSERLSWTGYLYGGLAHTSLIQYDADAEATGEASVRRGLQRMGLNPDAVAGWRVMEAGTGFYGLGLRRLGAVVEHRDLSTRTVEALNGYVARQGYANLESIRTDLVSDSLPENNYDLIYLSGIYQHFEDPERALVNLSRALKPGGYLYLDVYRSGRWRWFVVDVLRKIAGRDLLYEVLARFTEFCALGQQRSFHLRQVELLVDDLFVEHLHLFHPEDVQADAEALGLELIRPVTTMNLVDGKDRVDHSLLFAHVFNTLIFRKTGEASGKGEVGRTRRGRCQVGELEAMSGSYQRVLALASEFVMAHQGGRYSRSERVSHLVNLFRMAHPCLSGDPYFVPGRKEAMGSEKAQGDAETVARRHALWCTFLSHVLGRAGPDESVDMESLGYELVRFLS